MADGRNAQMSRTRAHLQKRLRQLGRDQRGVIAVVFAILFPVVAGILGFGVETGIWYSIKRHYQSIADVAAYSGALELAAGGTSAQAIAAAKNDASANNFPFSGVNSTSSVTVDPNGVCGASSCQTVTVTLQHDQTPLMVSYFLGKNAFTIADHAVAQVQTDVIDSCLSGVGKTGTSLLVKGGAPTLTLPGCTITSDSTDAKSIDLKGSAAADITAAGIYTAGGTSPACTTANFSNVTTLNCNATVPPVNPYASVTPPTMPTMPSSVTTFPGLAAVLSKPTIPSSVNAPAAPASQNGTTPPACAAVGVTTFASGQFCYTAPGNINIPTTATGFTAGKVYSFMGPVTITGAVPVGDNAQIVLKGAGDFTVSNGGSLTFAAVSKNNKPTSIFVSNGNFTSASGGSVIFTGGSPSAYAIKLATVGKSYSLAGSTTFGPADYGFFGGNLAFTGCAVFNPGTTTLDVANGNLTTGSGGAYFDATACNAPSNSAGSYALSATSYAFGGASTDIANFGPANYWFGGGSLTINGSATFRAGTTNVNIANGNLITAAASTLTFAAGSGSNYAFGLQNGGAYTIGGTATFGTGSPTAPNYAFYNGGLTIGASQNANFGPANYYVDSGSLTVNGCAAFQAATAPSTITLTTIDLKAGSLTSAAGSTVAFNPSGSVCGVTQTAGASTYNYYIKPGGGNVTLAGSTTSFGASNYYFYAGNVTLSGTTATLGAGIYSLQTGSFSIGAAGTTATVASDLTPTYIYEPSGTFSNAGKITFAAGTMYFYDGPGGFTSTGTAAGALTFTGGNNSGGSASTYYFYNGGSIGALNIAANANAAFGPANYYIINGDLDIGSGATLSCPNCAAAGTAGAGDTFILTQSASGGSIGTVQIPSAINGTLTAPGTSCSFSTPGCYKGLLIFQDPRATLGATNNGGHCQSNCNVTDVGDSVNMTGAIYLPKGVVDFLGGHASANCLVLIDLETTFQSNVSLTTNGCAAGGVGTVTSTINQAVLTQ